MDKKSNPILSTTIIGTLIVAIILTVGTFTLGNIATKDTQEAVRNVSLLYLSELAGRREQVVSAILDDYIRDLDTALGLIDKDDLSSFENLKIYQLRMKQLYDLDKFAFVDTNGVIYTFRGTRNDIEEYQFNYQSISDPVITIKNLNSKEKKVIIAVPADNLKVEEKNLIACFMEIDMDKLLRNVSLQANNNTTFCNIYTQSGVALTDMVLGGLASEDNLLDAMKNAAYEEGFSFENMSKEFSSGTSGVVSFTYNGISETLYYVPVRGTDWMLTYLIRESIIGEQINTISRSIITRSLIQSVLTAIVLVGMFALIFTQQRQSAKAELAHEVSETENRIKQQELEEQLAMHEELLEQEKKRLEQDNMIKALSSDYRGVKNPGEDDTSIHAVGVGFEDIDEQMRESMAKSEELSVALHAADDAPETADDPDVPADVRSIKELDYEKGLEYCGDADDYLFALSTYADSVEEKAGQMEKSLEEGRLEDYALVVHSLKSMSKSIGAALLSEQAKDLEQMARSGDTAGVKEKSDAFLKGYRTLGSRIKALPEIKDI
jgi:HPt (histidine-containing phosphotransfer) domain-containing protein